LECTTEGVLFQGRGLDSIGFQIRDGDDKTAVRYVGSSGRLFRVNSDLYHLWRRIDQSLLIDMYQQRLGCAGATGTYG